MKMTSNEIEGLYQEIAQEVYDQLPDDGWSEAVYWVKVITRFREGGGTYTLSNGEVKSFSSFVVGDAFVELRNKMAKIDEKGHAWYEGKVSIKADGNFKFYFSYDELPRFKVSPSKDKWEEEFKKHPRPELEGNIPEPEAD